LNGSEKDGFRMGEWLVIMAEKDGISIAEAVRKARKLEIIECSYRDMRVFIRHLEDTYCEDTTHERRHPYLSILHRACSHARNWASHLRSKSAG
jgi:hypothetical protein